VGDVLGRGDEAGRRERDRLAEPAVDVTARAGREQRSELVERPAGHREPGDDVLADRLVQEVLGCDDAAVAGVDRLLARDAEHAAEVVGVGVGVDHGGDRSLTQRVVGEREAVAGAALRR
jgi:hypothetical protein